MHAHCEIFKETELFIIKWKASLPFSSPWCPLITTECVSFQVWCVTVCTYVHRETGTQIFNINGIDHRINIISCFSFSLNDISQNQCEEGITVPMCQARKQTLGVIKQLYLIRQQFPLHDRFVEGSIIFLFYIQFQCLILQFLQLPYSRSSFLPSTPILKAEPYFLLCAWASVPYLLPIIWVYNNVICFNFAMPHLGSAFPT